MVMGFGSCLFECGNPNNSESAHDLDFPGAAVDDLGKGTTPRCSPVALRAPSAQRRRPPPTPRPGTPPALRRFRDMWYERKSKIAAWTS